MARLTDAIISKGKAYAQPAPALNIARGGQQGYIPRFGAIGQDGKLYEEWVNAHLYIKQNVIPMVLRYPRFLDYMPDKKYWIAGYKSMMEEHPISIDGLNTGLTVSTDEEAVGGGGEYMEEPTDVKRNRSQLSYQIPDKGGKSLQRMLDFIIRYGMKDPDTKKPLVSQFFDTERDIGMYTPDFYTGMCIFIEPDLTHQYAIDAWLCFNMFPKGTGDRTGSRNLVNAGEKNVLSIEFSSITMNNEAVISLANKLLKKTLILKSIPDTDIITPIQDVDPSVAAIDGGFNRASK